RLALSCRIVNVGGLSSNDEFLPSLGPPHPGRRRRARLSPGHARHPQSPLRALRRIKAETPDLLITTLVMRELGGFEVIRRVRGLGLSIPIVMITGYGNEKTAIEATRLGVSDYLEKPVAPEELRARLDKIFAAQDHPA